MDAFKALGHHGSNTQQSGSLCGPVTGTTSAVLLARKNDERNAFLLVPHRGIINARAFTVGVKNCDATFDAWNHQVFNPNVREGTPDHCLVIASSRSIAIEVTYINAAFL